MCVCVFIYVFCGKHSQTVHSGMLSVPVPTWKGWLLLPLDEVTMLFP